MERKISYLNKDFTDFKKSLMDLTKQYYPELSDSFNDASVGSWLMDMIAGVSDSLSYNIDRAYSETDINSAQEISSLYNLARSNGVKIPGPKSSIVELEVSVDVPYKSGSSSDNVTVSRVADMNFAPILKKGTKFTNGTQTFELNYDVDFREPFDINGNPNRTINEIRDSNGNILRFRLAKTFAVTAGETKVLTQEIQSRNIRPFMEVILPYKNVIGIESIIFQEGQNYRVAPSMSDFMIDEEYIPSENTTGKKTDMYRFFEVDSLAQQYRWGKSVDSNFKPIVNKYGYYDESLYTVVPSASITKGEWKPLRQKFITEYTDKGYLKIIFGAGTDKKNEELVMGSRESYTKYLISRMINNDALGVLPKAGTTMHILYRIGGGLSTNVPTGSINKISYLNIDFANCNYVMGKDIPISDIKKTIRVRNTSPSVSGKDMMTKEEIRNYIKYNKGAQDRCVTINDYKSRIMEMPSAFGTPYRVGVTEENNKIMVYLLGLDKDGKLSQDIPDAMISNLQNYISEYRMINDYVEMKVGRIVNLSFDIDCFIGKEYNQSDIVTKIIETVKNYMSTDRHQMGDDVFLGDLSKEISKIDGVINLIDLRVYNEYGDGYSKTRTTQQIVSQTECANVEGEYDETFTNGRDQIDLKASDFMVVSDNDTMLEIKYPEKDIRCRFKVK